MKAQVVRATMLAVGFGCVTATVSGETAEGLAKKITAATKNLKSFSAKTRTVTNMKQPSFSMVSTMTGTTELLRKGDEFLMRNESKNVAETTIGGNTSKQTTSMMMIDDGKYVYTVSNMSGMKSGTKAKSTHMYSPTDPFKMWEGRADLKALPDASVDGHAAWVVEATPRQNPMGMGKTTVYFQKDSGVMIKMVMQGPDGKPMTTLTLSDIKVNGKVSPDRFVFKAPAGVTIQDMTK